MKQYDDTNRGAIWPAKEKKTEKHPDYTGHLNVEGHEYFISAWKKTGDNPKAPVLSFSVKRKDSMPPKDYAQQKEDPKPENTSNYVPPDDIGDLPF